MRRKILSALLAFAMVLTLLPTVALAEENGPAQEEMTQIVPAQPVEEQEEQETVPPVAEGTATIYVNEAAEDDVAAGTAEDPYKTLQAAVNAAPSGAVIQLMSDLHVSSDAGLNSAAILINKGITLEGNTHVITASGISNNAHVVGVHECAEPVVIRNLTIVGGAGAKHCLNVFNSSNVTLNNVTLQNAATAGMVINGSNVTASGLTTSGNTWGAVNVDRGSTFTLTGSNLAENAQIWTEDGSTINAAGYTAVTGGVAGDGSLKGYTYYTTDPAKLGEAAIGNHVYATLSQAVEQAKGTGEVKLLRDVALSAGIQISGSFVLDGGHHTITANFSDSNVITVQSANGAAVKNVNIVAGSAGQPKHGINVYTSQNVALENISVSGMKGLGLLVNASTATATGKLTLANNGWGNNINVGWGSGIQGVSVCSFDASGAVLEGVDKVYADAGDVSRAGGVDKFVITMPAPYTCTANSEAGICYESARIVMDGKNYSTLEAAVAASSENSVIELMGDVVVSETVVINHNLTINGNGHTISGEGITNTNNIIGFLVADGTATFQNVKLTKFDNNPNAPYGSVIKIDAGSDGARVVADRVTISRFTRDAFTFKAGSFSVSNCEINCEPWSERGNKLTKGFQIGFGTTPVTGEIVDTTVYNTESNYEKWSSAAIEVFNNASVTIKGGSISQCKTGIHVDHYWAGSDSYPSLKGDVSVSIHGTSITAEENAVRLYSKENPTDKVTVSITGGNFVGNVAITDKSELDTLSITGGTFSADPSAYVPAGYVVSGNGPFTVSAYVPPYIPPVNGGGSGNSQTVTNPDGSTTTTVTKPDGTVTTTNKDTQGNVSETVSKPDGTSTTKVTNTNGSSSVTTVGQNGKVEAEVRLPQNVVANAGGEAVALPMAPVPVTDSQAVAPVVTIDLPAGTAAKVEVPVANVTAGTVAILVKADGSQEIVKTSVTTGNGVALTVEDGAKLMIVDNSKDFADVPASYWGSDAVDFASSRELFTGTSATSFSPEMDMDRAMIVTVLARLEGVDTTTGSTWYESAVIWAKENGISDGTSLTDSVSREQLVTMLYRYAGSPAVSGASAAGFADADSVSDWAKDAMAWAVSEGIISGVDGMLDPSGEATRAQVATILMRFVTTL